MTAVEQRLTQKEDGWAMIRVDKSGGPAFEGELWLIVSKTIGDSDVLISQEHSDFDSANVAAHRLSSGVKDLVVRIIRANFVATGNPSESAMIDFDWVPGRFINGQFFESKKARPQA